jgi:hypothetical protein
MTFFDKPRANPGIGRLIHRFLAVRGSTHRHDLLTAVAPPGSPYTGTAGNALDETVDVCLAVGAIERADGDLLSIAEGDEAVAVDVPSFRHYLRRKVFAPNTPPADLESSDDVDLSRAIAWFLGHDPLHPFFPFGSNQGSPEPERAQDDELGFANRVIKNDAQWGSFVRWSTFLGFSERMPARRSALLIPDPTAAVADIVSLLSGSMTPAELVGVLADALPVLDGGVVRTRFEAEAGRPQGRAVSASLSCALRRLAELGVLRLDNPADAPEQDRAVLAIGADAATVANIVIGLDA